MAVADIGPEGVIAIFPVPIVPVCTLEKTDLQESFHARIVAETGIWSPVIVES
jgi:hypothetical protein